MTRLLEQPQDAPLADRLAPPPLPGFRMVWLGQAGFVVEIAGRRLVIDPYLSDSLAEKYRGTPVPHDRMMPPPVRPKEIRHVDLVLATHHHTDHMDAETLRPLLAASPRARLLAPAASGELAAARAGIEPERLLAIDAGEAVAPFIGLTVTATAAAHEARELDGAGRHRLRNRRARRATKFPLFGVPCGAQLDSHQQFIVASMMGPDDVAVVISNTGSTRSILRVAQTARASGAKVIALVGTESPLMSYCDVALLVRTLDNTNTYTPTTSRIAAFVVIDILSTSVALTRDPEHKKKVAQMKRRLQAFREFDTT